MKQPSTVSALAGALLTGLAGCVPYNSHNRSYGQAEFDRDWGQCGRENPFREPSGDRTIVRQCMESRGWSLVP